MEKNIGRPRKIERNKLIVKLIRQGKSYAEVARLLNLKSRANVWEIYKRECSEKLSTP